jgi:hypothetical protein
LARCIEGRYNGHYPPLPYKEYGVDSRQIFAYNKKPGEIWGFSMELIG